VDCRVVVVAIHIACIPISISIFEDGADEAEAVVVRANTGFARIQTIT
jgi:hypothetical protein